MGRIEIILIVVACSIPFLALLFVLPNIKKARKNKKALVETTKYEPDKPVEKPVSEPAKPINSSGLTTQHDFSNYARNKKFSRPNFKQFDPNSPATSKYDFMSSVRRPVPPPQKTVKEQIDAMSPELKAVLFSNIFTTKF